MRACTIGFDTDHQCSTIKLVTTDCADAVGTGFVGRGLAPALAPGLLCELKRLGVGEFWPKGVAT